MKLLFVCTGNTCRSPMAESMARALALQRGLSLTVASAGLAATAGQSASMGARLAMRAAGLSLDGHCARPFHPDMTRDALVLTMTARQAAQVRDLAPRAKVQTLAQWAGMSDEVQDPFGGDGACYQACAGQLRRLLEKGFALHGSI